MKKLGVIGGLGPMATAYFMELVIEMTDADEDQKHIEMLIHNCPSIPDRTRYILGLSPENPLEPMVAVGRKLAENGAEVIAIPCVTAGCFYEELTAGIPVPVISTIEETASYLQKEHISEIGLMATDGTIESRVFQDALEKKNIKVYLPGKRGQEDVMHLIYENVKASKPIEMSRFKRVSEELREKGSQIVLLGCTELSMIRKTKVLGAGYLDVMQLLAKCAVEQCGILKKEYEDLITKE